MTYDPGDFFGHVQWWAQVEPATDDHALCPPFSVALIDADGTLLLTFDMDDDVVALMNSVRTVRAAKPGRTVQIADGTRSVIAWCNVTEGGVEAWAAVDTILNDTLERCPLSDDDKLMVRMSAAGELDDLIGLQ